MLRAPGTKMEVILSTAEYKPGEMIPRHIHHGEEAFYVLEGATVEVPDGKQIELKTGSGSTCATCRMPASRSSATSR